MFVSGPISSNSENSVGHLEKCGVTARWANSYPGDIF